MDVISCLLRATSVNQNWTKPICLQATFHIFYHDVDILFISEASRWHNCKDFAPLWFMSFDRWSLRWWLCYLQRYSSHHLFSLRSYSAVDKVYYDSTNNYVNDDWFDIREISPCDSIIYYIHSFAVDLFPALQQIRREQWMAKAINFRKNKQGKIIWNVVFLCVFMSVTYTR